ncbi:MAG: hypothetical protein HQL48_05255, partial [Gammaproteobacteria bacterium]|nr:hypothetical protein [Gammaproteobacteria bacterium]
TLKQSEFAADISQVALGKATPEYQDAAKFFARTFITEGMRLLLISVAQRLCGKAVPNAILLGSLPLSDLEVGGAAGQRALIPKTVENTEFQGVGKCGYSRREAA